MRSAPHPPHHRVTTLRRAGGRLGVALAGLLVVAGLVVMPAGSAAANDLEGASPGSGAKLRNAPGEIQLTFDDLVLGGASVSVSGPNGSVRGDTRAMGKTVTRSLRGSLGPGGYTVSWSVRSILREDSGSYSFTVLGAKPKPKPTKTTAKPTPSKTPTPTPTPKATRSPTPSPTPTRSPRPRPSTTDEATPVPTEAIAAPQVQGVSYTGSGLLPSPVVLWGLLMVAIVIGAVIARLRRNPRE